VLTHPPLLLLLRSLLSHKTNGKFFSNPTVFTTTVEMPYKKKVITPKFELINPHV